MSFLLDNPPKSPQFYPIRNGTPTWAVCLHTSEGPRDAFSLAGFIARRSDPGSYATIVDANTTLDLVPHTYTTFSVATPSYNSRTYSICIAGKSAELSVSDPYTVACIDRVASVIVNLWSIVGVDAVASAQWIGSEALNRAGLFCHGDVQADRSDAWARHPERSQLDKLLVDAILRHASQNGDDEMKSILVLDPADGRKVWEVWGLFRRHVSPDVFSVKRYLGVQYLDGSSDAAFRKFCIESTSEVK